MRVELTHDADCTTPVIQLIVAQREYHLVRTIENGTVYAESAANMTGDIVSGSLLCETCGAEETYSEDALPDYEYEN